MDVPRRPGTGLGRGPRSPHRGITRLPGAWRQDLGDRPLRPPVCGDQPVLLRGRHRSRSGQRPSDRRRQRLPGSHRGDPRRRHRLLCTGTGHPSILTAHGGARRDRPVVSPDRVIPGQGLGRNDRRRRACPPVAISSMPDQGQARRLLQEAARRRSIEQRGRIPTGVLEPDSPGPPRRNPCGADASGCDLVTVDHADGGEGLVTAGTAAARQPRPGVPAPTAGQPRLHLTSIHPAVQGVDAWR